jgi:site-specific DNA-methyltransferase (adenine-specific)
MKCELICGDCITEMQKLINKGITVNMSFADLPYNETGNKWDKQIDHVKMFDCLKQLVTPNGAMVFTGSFKFGTTLYNTCPELYKYDWVWEKDNGTNVPNINYQPFRVHEQIFVYGKGRVSYGKKTPMKYNPQKTKGKPYVSTSSREDSENWKGGLNTFTTVNREGDRHPKTIQYFVRDKGYHPTQKPVKMLEYLIKTYTDEGDTVLDFVMGSGSTGVACLNTNRNFIGIELEEKYYNIAKKRCREYQSKLI